MEAISCIAETLTKHHSAQMFTRKDEREGKGKGKARGKAILFVCACTHDRVYRLLYTVYLYLSFYLTNTY